jgi:hypothetical protein
LKKVVCLAFAILLAFLLVPWYTDEVQAAPGDDVKIELEIKLSDVGRGHLEFFVGSGSPRNLIHATKIPGTPTVYNDKNINKLIFSLQEKGADRISIFRAIFNHSSEVELSNVNISLRDETSYFCFSFQCDFYFVFGGKIGEYRYLSFLYDYEDKFNVDDGIGGISDTVRREREMNKVNIDLTIELDSSLSMTSSSIILGHERSINKEKLHDNTDATWFLRNSNRLKVFENSLISPFSIFILWLSILIIGYGFLSFLWWRKRFKNLGLITPLITILFSGFLITSFFLPGLSFYEMGGFSLWIYSGIFLFLLGICTISHPGGHIDGYDEARKGRFKMPKIIYIDRHIFVDRSNTPKEERMDPYEVLGVDPKSSFEEIEDAYRKKIKEYHPDKYMNSPERIRSFTVKETERLNTAYETLKRKFGG